MRRAFTILGFGLLGACVIYTGYDIARHADGEEELICDAADVERELLLQDVDIHLQYLVASRNAIARRYGMPER